MSLRQSSPCRRVLSFQGRGGKSIHRGSEGPGAIDWMYGPDGQDDARSAAAAGNEMVAARRGTAARAPRDTERYPGEHGIVSPAADEMMQWVSK